MKHTLIIILSALVLIPSIAIAGKSVVRSPVISPPPSKQTKTLSNLTKSSITSFGVAKSSASSTALATSSKVVSTEVIEDTTLNTGPEIALTANQESKSTTILYNDPVSIQWTSKNVDWCTNPYVAALPNYDKPLTDSLSGEMDIDNATTTQIFQINCRQNGRVFVTSTIIIYVEKEPAPTVSLTADDEKSSIDINYGSSMNLVWESTNTSTSSCNLLLSTSTEKWALSQEKISITPSGRMNSRILYTPEVFSVVCENSSGIATSSVLVNILPRNFGVMADVLGTKKSTQCVDIKNNIRYGSSNKNTGNEVSLLQEFLDSIGLYKNKNSGFIGKGTVRAIQSFQKKEGIDSTGFVGSLTRTKIKEVSCRGL